MIGAAERTCFARVALNAREILSRRYPKAYVERHFEGPKSLEHGVQHGENVFALGLKICTLAGVKLSNEEVETLALLAIIHDFCDDVNATVNQIFASGLQAPTILAKGLPPTLSAEVNHQFERFIRTLSTRKSVREFHNYSGAGVAVELARELGWEGDRVETVCHSVMFHGIRDLNLFREIPKHSWLLASLLYSGDKLASTGSKGMERFPLINVVRFGRFFYDAEIDLEFRRALMTTKELRPEQQEPAIRKTKPGFRFDCLQFMINHLFKDSLDPGSYPDPSLVVSYLNDENVFSVSLNAFLGFAKEYHGTDHSRGDAFDGMKNLLLFALASEKYVRFVDQIRSGIAQVDSFVTDNQIS